MKTDEFLRILDRAWAPARAMGALGSASIDELCDHAAGFVPAAFRVPSPTRCLDVGSGVGLPGLVLAHLMPESRWLLLDASERRCDLARQAVEACELESRVEVCHGRVEDLGRDSEFRRGFDLVVCRLFAPFSETAECCLPLVAMGGRMVVSSSEEALATWQDADLAALGAAFAGSWRTDSGLYVGLAGVKGLVSRFPRRGPARRRDPFVG